MILIDTHTHLYLREFNTDRDRVVKNALHNGIRIMLLPNIDSGTVDAMLELADEYPGYCLPTIGLHPTSVKTGHREEIRSLVRLMDKRKYWGIGETGIDLYWDKTYAKQQEESFMEHILLAKETKLPLIIHARNSFDELFRVLDRENDDSLKGVFHAFTGDEIQAKRILAYGFKLGIGGIVTYRNAGLDNVLNKISLEHIVLETDAPYLAPVPFRGRRNEPSYLIHTAEKLALMHGLPLEKIAEITTRNAIDLFNLKI